MADMDRANRQMRRASRRLGCLYSLWLAGFWAIVLGVAGVFLWSWLR